MVELRVKLRGYRVGRKGRLWDRGRLMGLEVG